MSGAAFAKEPQRGSRMITTLTDEQVRKLFQSARVARLGCVVHGEPYIIPINYNFVDDCVYSHSLPGMKISGLRENPRACVQVDEIESDLRWRSALAFGNFEELTKPDERHEILAALLQRFPMLTPVEAAIAEDAGSQQVIVYRITIDKLTGVAEG